MSPAALVDTSILADFNEMCRMIASEIGHCAPTDLGSHGKISAAMTDCFHLVYLHILGSE